MKSIIFLFITVMLILIPMVRGIDCTDTGSDGITNGIILIGATSHCTTDGTNDEIQIQQAFDNASGKTVAFNSGDVFNIDTAGSLFLNVSNVILTSSGSTRATLNFRVANAGAESMLFIPQKYSNTDTSPPIKRTNITIKNLNFKGTDDYNTADHAIIEVNGVDNFTLDNVTENIFFWQFLYINGYQNALSKGTNLTISNSKFYKSGINFAYITNAYVFNNAFDGLGSQRECSIDANRNNLNVYVHDNWVSNDATGNTPATKLYASDNQNFYNNTIVKGVHGIALWSNWGSTVNIYNNTINGTFTTSGFNIAQQSGASGANFHNNIIRTSGVPAILSYSEYSGKSATSVNVYSNTIYGASDGIKLNEALITINAKNNIIINGTGYGINKLSGTYVGSYNDIWNNVLGNYLGVSAGTGDISSNPLFASTSDFHLKSQAGRWNGSAWVTDTVTSTAIDAGDPAFSNSNEPAPNGGRINMGDYGNSPEASKSFGFFPTPTPTPTPSPTPTVTPTPSPTPTPTPTATPTPSPTPTPTPISTAVYDNRLREVSPDSVLGGGSFMDIGHIPSIGIYRDVLWFNLSLYNKTDIIDNATLSLFWYYPASTRNQSTTVEIYRSFGWDPTYVSWNNRTYNTPWNTPGGEWFDRNDAAKGSVPFASITFNASTIADNRYYNFNVTELAQAYVSGKYNNTGFFLKAKNENDNYIAFYSSDWSNASQIPKLVINYTPSNSHSVTESGDLNNDGTVNFQDLIIVSQHFGEVTLAPYPIYDINGDGRVDITDILLVSNKIA